MTTPHCPTHHRPLICPACNGARGGKSKSAKKIAKVTETIKQVNDRRKGERQMTNDGLDLTTQTNRAREMRDKYRRPVWLYRHGSIYGFRFAPLPETEDGELVEKIDA